MNQSQAWQLNLTDMKRVLKNALIFLAPVAITELTLFQQGVTNPQVYLISFEVWSLGVLMDFFRKLKAGN